jgi:hypothetical protein
MHVLSLIIVVGGGASVPSFNGHIQTMNISAKFMTSIPYNCIHIYSVLVNDETLCILFLRVYFLSCVTA